MRRNRIWRETVKDAAERVQGHASDNARSAGLVDLGFDLGAHLPLLKTTVRIRRSVGWTAVPPGRAPQAIDRQVTSERHFQDQPGAHRLRFVDVRWENCIAPGFSPNAAAITAAAPSGREHRHERHASAGGVPGALPVQVRHPMSSSNIQFEVIDT
jgi:hypothetical protein